MALPQKVLEQIGREPPKTPGWSGQLLMFSSTVFFIALAIYLGLAYGYRPYLEGQVAKLNDSINNFAEQVPADEQAKIISFYSQILNLKGELSNHVAMSKLFAFLESNTQANVYFSKLTFVKNARGITLNGLAKSMPDIVQQLEIFQEQPEVQSVSLGNASFFNNMWQFDLTLQLDPAFFSAASGPVSPPPAPPAPPAPQQQQ